MVRFSPGRPLPAAIIVRIKELGGHEVAVDSLETKMVLPLQRMEPQLFGVISGLRRDVDEICALLGCYAAWSGNSLPTFRDDLSVPSCGFGGLEVACWPLVPKFAGSNPAEAVGFFRAKKSSVRLPSEGK